MIATVFDYGAGNLHSLGKALAAGGADVRLERDPARAIETDLLVLPGVGAFASAAERLAPGRERMREAIAGGLPCLGVCLGMQLLFTGSEEGEGQGLELFRGPVTRLGARQVPHIGWNTVDWEDAYPSGGTPNGRTQSWGYFAHSFAARPVDESCVVAWTTHERDRFPAAVRSGNVLGVQFHPEKSSSLGVRLIGEWLAAVASGRAHARGATQPAHARTAL